ncbi:MAG: ParA family protein [Deltaproteobacteria bacterium]|nr:MAG: ParA family protein [Deltaproteobacteria bacterium]
MYILAIASAKGGVGKTTSAIHIATALTLFGSQSLIVDFDPQGAVAPMLGLPEPSREETFGAQLSQDQPLQTYTVEKFPELQVLPAHPEWDELQSTFPQGTLREKAKNLENPPDFVLLDLAPSMEPLTRWALNEADAAMLIVQPSALSIRTLPALLRTIQSESLNTHIEGLLVNQMGVNNELSSRIVYTLMEEFQQWLFPVRIPHDDVLQQSFLRGQSLFWENHNTEAAQAYQRVARELIRRHKRPAMSPSPSVQASIMAHA